jgi:long-chain acyl-CoA synthetase
MNANAPLGTSRLTARGGPFELAAQGNGRAPPVFAGGAQTLLEIILRARRFGLRPWLVGDPDGAFENLISRGDRIAAHLYARKCERVGVAATGPSNWIAGFLGCVLAGKVPVLLDPALSPEDLSALVASTGIRSALVDEGATRLKVLGLVQCEEISTWLSAPAATIEAPAIEVGATDDAIVVTTSGTTGAPKALVFDHLSVATGLRALLLGAAVAALRDGPLAVIAGSGRTRPCALVSGPLFHISGFGPILLALLTGAGVLVLPKWPGANLGRIVEDNQVTSIGGLTPDQVHDVLATPADALRSIVSVNVQGGAIANCLLRHLRNHLTHVRVTSNYGLTESLGVGANAAAQDLVLDSNTSGLISPLMEVRIVGRDGGEAIAEAPGEIHLRGRSLARSYCANNQRLLSDGWFRTGDLGRLDAEGRLHVLGRARDSAWLGERLVTAQYLENQAMADARVRRAACVYDPERGAFALRIEAIGEAAAEVEAQILRTIPELGEHLTITQADELTMTQTGKISRKPAAG